MRPHKDRHFFNIMASSKRPIANASGSEAKRARLRGHEYDVELSGETYVNVDLLFQCAELKDYFAKRYKRSAKHFICEEDLHVVFVSKRNVENDELELKTSYSSRTDVRLVKKNAHVERIIATAKENSHALAPPVLVDKDLSFFVNKAGTLHQVEMRGERTMDGIYFKAKDVGVVFESRRLPEIIQRDDITYRESIDFVRFALHNSTPGGNLQPIPSDTSDEGHPRDSDTPPQERVPKRTYNQSQEIFLTFSGLMHALHNTRSPVAEEFRGWVYKQVFTLAYGTVTQKKEMLQTLCKIDKSFLQAFMKLVPSNLACIYLVDTTMREGDAKVYKFGRSGKIKNRFYDHHNAFGAGTLLDTVIFVPADALSEAETILRKSLIPEIQFRYDTTRELVTLTDVNRKAVRTIMQTIADKYNGSMAIQASKHEEEIKDLKHAHMVEVGDLKHARATEVSDLKHARATEVSDLKHASTTEVGDLKCTFELRVKDLERIVEVFERRMETEALRLENAKLVAASEAALAAGRNDALQKTNDVLQKTNDVLQKTTDAYIARIRELEERSRTVN
ncbi:hypothetical protein Gpo141_00012359 [Globisporangium polare]